MSANFKPRELRLLVILAMVLIALGGAGASRLAAQGTTATILGTVTDSSGAAIPEAALQVRNVGTGGTQSSVSDAQGRFRVADLGIGDYEVQAGKTGFSTVVRKGITLTVGSQSVVDFSLPVGQQQQTVTVEAQTSQVETTSATVGSLVDQRQMRELPLNGRNFEQLIFLAPGVQVITSTAPIARQGREPSFSAAGARPEGQAILMDDEDIQNFYRRGVGTISGSSLGVESIAEFQTLTNTYSAQFGGNGVVINAVSKSGTNTFHGSAFDFLRNSALDARSPFDPGSSPPPFRKNQFGGSVGGPIKKDKMFVFANYEGIRQLLGVTRIATVPDAAHRGPTSAVTNPVTRQAIIDTLAIYPQPTFNFNSAAGTGQVTSVDNQTLHENYFLARFDYNVSEKDSVFLRYFLDKQYLLDPFSGGGPGFLPFWPEADYNANHFATAEWKRIISPTKVNTARISFSRPNTPTYLVGGTPALQFFPASSGRPNAVIGISGITGLGPNAMAPASQLENKYTEGDDFLWTRGSHSIRLGITVMRQQTNVYFPVRSGSTWSFPSLAVFQAGGNAQTTVVGTPLGPQYYPSRNYREIDITPYIQDDWKVTSKLTLNLGLRWDYTTNAIDAHNAFYAVTDYAHATDFVNVPHANENNPNSRNFDPRFGFAYDVFSDHKTAIRGGIGITHSPIYVGNYNPNYASSRPWDGLQQSNPIYPIPFTAISQVLPSVATGYSWFINTSPYLLQYNLNVQREIAEGTVLSVGYIGSHGVHLLTQQEQNPPLATIDSNGVYHFSDVAGATITVKPRLNKNFSVLTLAVPNTTSRYNSLQVSLNRRLTRNVQAQVAYTYSNCIDDGGFPIGSLNGGNSPTAYENPYDRSIDRGLCFFNVKHALRVNGLVNLPFHGNRLVEGWQITGIASASSGFPFSISTGFDRVGYAGSGTPRPDYAPNNPATAVGNISYPACNNSPIIGTVAQWFNPNCFSLQAAETLGNLGRNTIIGPNNVNFDFALLKDTRIPKITETFRVQFRAELFNTFNHPNYALPGASVFTASGRNASAGQITNIVGSMRQIQLGLKFIF